MVTFNKVDFLEKNPTGNKLRASTSYQPRIDHKCVWSIFIVAKVYFKSRGKADGGAFMIITDFFTTTRMAGLLMILSILIIVGAVGLIAIQGRLGGMVAGFGGLTPEIGDASGLRTIGRAGLLYTMAQLAGFTLLTLVLVREGDRGAAVVGLVFLVVWSILGAVEGSFQASVTVWAAEQTARTGTPPEFFEPLRRWLNSELQLVNMSFGLLAMLLFSISVLNIGLLPPWISWTALIWSILSFPVYYLVLGAPLIILLTPLLLGAGLIMQG